MKNVLRLEHLIVFVALTALYGFLGYGWMFFALLFLAPDLAFVAYLAGPRIGAWVYNATHFAGIAISLCVTGLYFSNDTCIQLGLIMGAHIAFDRMLGYGLKHESNFKDTHLGRIGGG